MALPIQKGIIYSTSATPEGQDDDETIMAKALVIADLIAFPMTMQSALELGLLEIIANREKHTGGLVTPSEVVAELQTDNPRAADMVERMLRVLTAFSVVNCSLEAGRGKVFGMSPVGRLFVKDEDGVSLGPLMILHHDKVYRESWHKQKDAVLEGGVPFDKAHGTPVFEYTGVDPRFNQVFNKAMQNCTTILMNKIIQSYTGFEKVNHLVDVGGGIGHSLGIIVSKYPKIKGVNFDLPHVVKHGISHRGIEHVGGDMFDKVPSGDTILMKNILHDWGDNYCIKLLKNCYEALPTYGKVININYILPEIPESTLIAQVVSQKDVIMMALQTGRERTEKEFIALAKAAGFADVRFVANVSGVGIMEFYKKIK